MLRNLDGANDAIDLQPPAKAAADQMIVDHDLVQREASGLRRRRLGARDNLVADPDLAGVLADMDRAVHRLHRGVRKERNLVGRLDFGGGVRQGFGAIADALRHRPRIERRLFELTRDRIGVELGVRTLIPFDRQGGEPFLRGSHVVGHDGNGVVEPHDLTHAPDGLGRGIVDALHAAAEHRRLRERRDLHARRSHIDAIDRRSIDLRRGVQTLRRLTDQLEILGPLQRHAFRNTHARSIGSKLAVSYASPRLRVMHFPALSTA